MAFSYAITIYEKSATTSIYPDMLAETFKLDESLDSAVITIPRVTRKAPFKRFSRVKIVKTDGFSNSITTYWLVFSTKADIGTKGSTNTYDHTLALIEPTKWLDKFLVGTKTFTQPLNGTQITLIEAIKQIINSTPLVPLQNQEATRLVGLDSDFEIDITGKKLPQMFFEKKNMREAFIGLFKSVNAIPRMFYDSTKSPTWRLKGDFINKRNLKFDIDIGSIDYKDEATGDNFAQRAELFHENTIPENFHKDTANIFANSITEYITFRSDEIIVGESNFKLVLANKMQKFISLELFVPLYGATPNVTVDITDYCYNKKVYDLLKYDILDVVPDDPYDGARSNSVYWQLGKNTIEGFNSTFNLFGTGLPLDNILTDIGYGGDTPVNNGYTFKVTYVPFIENMRSAQYRIDRNQYSLTEDMFDNMSSIMLNPSERINDLHDVTEKLYGELQRTGVDTVSISKKHYNIAPYDPDTNATGVYSLGDYTEDNFFVTKVEIIYFRAFIIARYELSRNWNRIAQFIQLDKEYRPYEIALTKTDYSLRRDIIIPLKYVLVSNANVESTLDTQTTLLKYHFLNTFRSISVRLDGLPFSAAALQINYKNATNLNETAVYKPLMIAAEKNTIKYKLDFFDTKSAGKKVKLENAIGVTNLQQSLVPYTLEDGTFQYGRIHLFKSYWGEISGAGTITRTNEMLAMQGNNFPEVTIHGTSTIRMIMSSSGTAGAGYPVFVEAHLYDTYADFPAFAAAIDNRYYLDNATVKLYYFSRTLFDYVLTGNAWLKEREPDFSTDIYEINKDQSEIFGVELPIPILPYDTQTDIFIIGNMISRKNVLVTGINEVLFWQTSATRYNKLQTDSIAVDLAGRVPLSLIGADSAITVPSAIYAENNFAIVDSLGNLFLAVNQIELDDTKTVISVIEFNFIDELDLYESSDAYSVDLSINIALSLATIYEKFEQLTVDMTETDTLEVDYLFQENLYEYVSMTENDVLNVSTIFEQDLRVEANIIDADTISVSVEMTQNTQEPTITFVSFVYDGHTFYTYTFSIKNNDDVAAEIFADSNATPTTSKGTLASQSTSNFDFATTATSATIYTRAKATDKGYSTVDDATGTIT